MKGIHFLQSSFTKLAPIVLSLAFVMPHKMIHGCDSMRKKLVARDKIRQHKIELKDLYDRIKFKYQPPLSFNEFLIMKIMTMEAENERSY